MGEVRRWLPVLGLVGAGAALALYYYYSTRRATVTYGERRGEVEVGAERLEVRGGRAPVCREVAPNRYECDSGFQEGETVVLVKEDGGVVMGRVVQTQPSPVPPEFPEGGGGVPEVRGEPAREVG